MNRQSKNEVLPLFDENGSHSSSAPTVIIIRNPRQRVRAGCIGFAFLMTGMAYLRSGGGSRRKNYQRRYGIPGKLHRCDRNRRPAAVGELELHVFSLCGCGIEFQHHLAVI